MITIYGAYRSRTTRVYWLVNELGIEVTQVPVMPAHHLKDPFAPDAQINTKSPEFLAISPTGAVPAMDDDDFFLTESLAINLYLARKSGGPLGPADPKEDAQMQRWSFFGATWIEPHALTIMYNEAGVAKDDAQAKAATDAAAETLRRPFGIVEKHLQSEGGLVGGRFTVADINLAEMMRYGQGHPTLFLEFPAVDAWIRKCQARQGFKDMWARRVAEMG